MEQINTNKEYNEYVKQKSPNSPILKDCFNAFWVGGLICSIGQIILDFCMFKGMDNTMASTVVSISLIAISAILTALNVYCCSTGFSIWYINFSNNWNYSSNIYLMDFLCSIKEKFYK